MVYSSDRPTRARALYLTVELCRNTHAGPHGSLELISSQLGFDQSQHFFWPLSERGALSPSQWEDLGAVLQMLATDSLLTRVHVEDQLFTTP